LPDITYLKKDEIGLVLAKALSETCKAQPKHPVEFFAKYLLNTQKVTLKAKEVFSSPSDPQFESKEKRARELREKHSESLRYEVFKVSCPIISKLER